MVWRSYSSCAMCVHDGSVPRGACACAAMSYAAELNRRPISRGDLLHRRCIIGGANVVWTRTRRGSSVSARCAFPRSMRLRVVGNQRHEKPGTLRNCVVYPKYGGYLCVFRTWRGARSSHLDSNFGNLTGARLRRYQLQCHLIML